MDVCKNHNFWKEFVEKNDRFDILRDRSKGNRRENKELRKRCGTERFSGTKPVEEPPLRLVGGCSPSSSKNQQDKTLQMDPRGKMCGNCQEVNYNIPFPGGTGTEICPRCQGIITYHVISCCPCGVQPYYPRPIYVNRKLTPFDEERGSRDFPDDFEK